MSGWLWGPLACEAVRQGPYSWHTTSPGWLAAVTGVIAHSRLSGHSSSECGAKQTPTCTQRWRRRGLNGLIEGWSWINIHPCLSHSILIWVGSHSKYSASYNRAMWNRSPKALVPLTSGLDSRPCSNYMEHIPIYKIHTLAAKVHATMLTPCLTQWTNSS